MTTGQIIGIVAVVVAVLANYGPMLFKGFSFGNGKTDPLKAIGNVMAIRDSTTDPEVKTKCVELLKALMG